MGPPIDELVDLDDSREPLRQQRQGPRLRRALREPRQRRPLRPVERLTAGGVAVALLGSGGGAVVFTQTSLLARRPVINAATLNGCAAALKKLRSFTVTNTETSSGVGGSAPLTFSTVADNVHHSYEVKATLDSLSLDVRAVGGTVYTRSTGDDESSDRPWESEPQSSSGASDGFGEDPAANLVVLKHLTGVRLLGRVPLHGLTTTHFVGSISVAALLAAEDPELDKASNAQLSGTLAVDVYVDDDGLIRRLRTTGDLVDDGRALHPVDTSDFGSFNAPVTIVAPPAAEVQPGSDGTITGPDDATPPSPTPTASPSVATLQQSAPTP